MKKKYSVYARYGNKLVREFTSVDKKKVKEYYHMLFGKEGTSKHYGFIK